MRPIYLVRHGRPSAAWGGDEGDPGLDPQGRAQAAEAAETLLRLAPEKRPERVASSPKRRCLETAQPLARVLGCEPEIVEAVGELPTPPRITDRAAWLGRSLRGQWSDIHGETDYRAWRDGVVAAVEARPGAAIFMHFVAINAVVSHLKGVDDVTVFRPGHAAITVLEVQNGRLAVIRLGEEGSTSVL